MAKAILISIQPQYVAKILNGEKTIEIRKKFPKNYVGWVYIYCTKKDSLCCIRQIGSDRYICGKDFNKKDFPRLSSGYEGKGKVVARFWCDKVSAIECVCCLTIPTIAYTTFLDRRYGYCSLLKASCLNDNEIMRYLGNKEGQSGYAIHISKLEVFDTPRILTMFRKPEFNKNIYDDNGNRLSLFERLRKYSITKAPQSWCYIEGKND